MIYRSRNLVFCMHVGPMQFNTFASQCDTDYMLLAEVRLSTQCSMTPGPAAAKATGRNPSS